MKSIFLAAYSCLLGLTVFLFLGMSAANADDHRAVYAPIDASVKFLEMDDRGVSYFELTNSGQGALFYDGYKHNEPEYRAQVRNPLGNWVDGEHRRTCGIGILRQKINPNQSVRFAVRKVSNPFRIGIYVTTDQDIDAPVSTLWSDSVLFGLEEVKLQNHRAL